MILDNPDFRNAIANTPHQVDGHESYWGIDPDSKRPVNQAVHLYRTPSNKRPQPSATDSPVPAKKRLTQTVISLPQGSSSREAFQSESRGNAVLTTSVQVKSPTPFVEAAKKGLQTLALTILESDHKIKAEFDVGSISLVYSAIPGELLKALLTRDLPRAKMESQSLKRILDDQYAKAERSDRPTIYVCAIADENGYSPSAEVLRKTIALVRKHTRDPGSALNDEDARMVMDMDTVMSRGKVPRKRRDAKKKHLRYALHLPTITKPLWGEPNRTAYRRPTCFAQDLKNTLTA